MSKFTDMLRDRAARLSLPPKPPDWTEVDLGADEGCAPPDYTFKREFDPLEFEDADQVQSSIRDWIADVCKWMDPRGVTFMRSSADDKRPNWQPMAVYVEGWYNEPVDQGPMPWLRAKQ